MLKLNIDKVLELNKRQNEKLADIQRKLELTSANITSLSIRMDRMEENAILGNMQVSSRGLESTSVVSLSRRVDRVEENYASRPSTKVPREISVSSVYQVQFTL